MTRDKVRILFELDPNDWHGGGSESMWAEPLFYNDRLVFKINNSPFCAREVSFGDIVAASPTKNRSVYEFAEVIKRSGHSTFVLLVKPGDVRVSSYWQPMEDAGCTYESGNEKWSGEIWTVYSVDVPPTTDLALVFKALEKGLEDGIWLVQEGYVHDAHRTLPPSA
ncbi:DUF4265 domain-containing protein [Bradyrhizobium betae]|uniref:DUF4265 domain-containing protein n=1 Tax=Bradyrhizobium betae TaxID=244734 RepID=UPI003D663CA7